MHAYMYVCNVQYYVPYNQKLSRDKNFVHESRGAKKEKYFSRQNFQLYCICQYMYNMYMYMVIYIVYMYNPQIPYCDIV